MYLWFALPLVILALCFRTIGIHIDENNYQFLAQTSLLGDAGTVGKSPVFYLLNYGLFHAFGPLFGPWKPFALHLCYGSFNLLCLTSFVKEVERERGRRVLLFFFLLLSPFYLLNSIQLMMETPILGLFAVVLSYVLSIKSNQTWNKKAFFVIAVVLLVVIKETSILTLVLLGGGLFTTRHPLRRPLLLAILLGIGLDLLLRALFHLPFLPRHGGGDLSRSLFVRFRFHPLWEFSKVWLFFLVPPVVAIFWGRWTKKKDEYLPQRFNLLLGALSLIGTLLIPFVSYYEFARYSFPSIWMGLLALSSYAMKHISLRGGILVVFLSLVPVSDMYRSGDNLMQFWPSLLSDEIAFNRYTIFSGIRINRWLILHPEERQNLSLFIDADSQEDSLSIQQFFYAVTQRDHLVFKEGLEEFIRFQGKKGLIGKYYGQEGGCTGCEGQTGYVINACVAQPLKVFSQGIKRAVHTACLPG